MQSGKHGTAFLARGKPDPKLLLPPLSVLAPSGPLAEAGEQLSCATSEIRTDTHTEQNVQQMASTLWAEHAPRIKASGSAAAEQVGKFADRVLHQGADTLHEAGAIMADPAKRSGLWARYRTLIMASGAGVAILAGLGWVAGCHEASRIANQKLHDVLDQAGLAPYVQYASVSASPFGNITVYDVKIRVSENDVHPVTIASVSVSGLSSSQTVPNALSLSARHVECPIGTANTLTAGDLSETKLSALGYSSITGDIALSYRLADRTLAFESNADFVQMGGWNVSFNLVDVPGTVFGSVSSLMQAGGFNPIVLMQMAQQFSTIKLQNADMQFDNRGFVQRLHAIPDTPFPQDQTLPGNATPFAQWNNQGGKLRIITQLEEPLPIMQSRFPYSSLFNPAFSNLDSFITRTHATVKVD